MGDKIVSGVNSRGIPKKSAMGDKNEHKIKSWYFDTKQDDDIIISFTFGYNMKLLNSIIN